MMMQSRSHRFRFCFFDLLTLCGLQFHGRSGFRVPRLAWSNERHSSETGRPSDQSSKQQTRFSTGLLGSLRPELFRSFSVSHGLPQAWHHARFRDPKLSRQSKAWQEVVFRGSWTLACTLSRWYCEASTRPRCTLAYCSMEEQRLPSCQARVVGNGKLEMFCERKTTRRYAADARASS